MNCRLNVALFYEIIAKSVPEAVKAQIDEFTGEIQESGKIDLQKDLFAHLGPKMVFYLAPGRSAATTNEESSLESLISNGLNPMAAAAGLPSLFPKLTMVAEVKNPEAFGKALDALIIAINSELKAQAIEKATHEREAEGDQAGAGGAARPGGRNQGARPGAGGDRTKRRASQGYPGTSFPSHARRKSIRTCSLRRPNPPCASARPVFARPSTSRTNTLRFRSRPTQLGRRSPL